MTTTIRSLYFVYILGITLLLTALAFSVNLHYQFPGNNYFPSDTSQSLITLILIFWGCKFSTSKTSHLTNIAREILYFFILMFIIALATNAVQLTPFNTIDNFILIAEHQLHINTPTLMAWTYQHPHLQHLLAFIYCTLPWQMSLIPLTIIFCGKFVLIREYYFLMISSVLLGFSIYYFFPTIAPASMLHSEYFTQEQLATGLKFMQIHQHVPPITSAGGLIAFPSFHIIWAWFCLYLVRSWLIIFYPLLLINILLAFSCVLLGWHYFLDIIMSIFIILICHYWLYKSYRVKNPLSN